MPHLRWLAALLLAGCTAASPTPTPQACTVRKAAEIPLGVERGFITAPVTLDGKPAALVIDTGAETSLVTPIAQTLLRLQPDPGRRTMVQGTGGTLTTQNVRLQSFGIGGMEVLDQSVAVGPLPAAQGAAMNASGLLGADWFRDFDVELDLPHRRMALYQVEGCRGDYVPWPGPKVSVVAEIYRRGLVILPAELDGQPITALLDSGANRSVVSTAAAERIGVGAAALARDRAGTAFGVDGASLTTHDHRFGELRVGAARYASPTLNVSPLRVTVADMLLGLDWLRGNRVWIAYAARRVTIQPSPPGTP
jgi:predicted aspartyl protease